ncbi:bifunctional 2-C-methyl-D-erythritol 4-phosphate cytidylyltransferase/2-C-methyl-D-erythritol 2,4-cyclodiphosphate synthase [Profundibacterium mesophilum]|uniref:Bifunctional enzyme IspD/IspF n=1 Tax=Profundibacterium mesophilum KAUST100406-0324 TaxID=1037889 RepID=A0A921NZF8_9RHOB|nr:bifunctional 2-C-methyl-D-erythritol 4-phosphate cytidylyltransferase/2-C-methyl-D-erythritol 2,4-cyclodiphosphate synthase [Profundibacterium mesophilum]KAF0677484.1 2-C-methyl-D-erythritol 24-cyclodiphosphate synthase [Profundibacterium mesophilum KAUST100406-0324]
MKTAAVIVAAGRGRRVGGPVPKQWRMLSGRAVLAWTLDALRTHPGIDLTVLVLSPDDMGMAAGYAAHEGVTVVPGGESRSASVRAGLASLENRGIGRVLIHDVARPLVSPALITRVIAALETASGAAPALAVTDALWTGEEGRVTGTRPRAGLYRAQTPQGFDFTAILAAHRAHRGDAADDVEVALAAGLDVSIVEGEERNLKITVEGDFARAETLMEARLDIRTGNGFDVHAFEEGDHVTLCGIDLPHHKALKGHSDADVGMHAVTDAIYGALAEGDIGRHFPPSQERWRDAASEIFLSHAVSRIAARGFTLGNIDLTLICETPKITPHAQEMRDNLARIAGIDIDRVSVKATTSERLGFAGREEGIAAMASVTLVAS